MKKTTFSSLVENSKKIYKLAINVKFINYFLITSWIIILISLILLLFAIIFNNNNFDSTKLPLIIVSMCILFITLVILNIFTYIRRKASFYYSKIINFQSLYENQLLESNLIDKKISMGDIKDDTMINKFVSFSNNFNNYFYSKWHSSIVLSKKNEDINLSFWKAFYLNERNTKKESMHFIISKDIDSSLSLIISNKKLNDSFVQVTHNLFCNDLDYINYVKDASQKINNILENVENVIIEFKNNVQTIFIIAHDNFLLLNEKTYKFWKNNINNLELQSKKDFNTLVSILEY